MSDKVKAFRINEDHILEMVSGTFESEDKAISSGKLRTGQYIFLPVIEVTNSKTKKAKPNGKTKNEKPQEEETEQAEDTEETE